MKSWFSRKNKQPQAASQEYYQQPRPKVDVSGTYDYDKIAQNQFLTNDIKDGTYFRNDDNYTGRNDATYKEKRMAMEEEAFQRINQNIHSNIHNNEQEFSYLNQVSENIANEHKIPVKKKGFFGRRENVADGYPSYSVQETYHIQDNQSQKYDARVDYNALKNEQTKLLDLSNLDDNPENSQDLPTCESHAFCVDKQKDEQLTNRLFQPENYLMPETRDNVVIDTTPIAPPHQASPAPTPAPISNPNPAPFVQPTMPKDVDTTPPNVSSNNSMHQPIPTTALRYLTPVEESPEELRVKKENRRFVKMKG